MEKRDNKQEGLKVKDLLRSARIKAGLSQGKVAKAKGVNVTPAYISKLETGDSIPSDQLCIGLARILGINEKQLRILALIEREGPEIEALLYPEKGKSLTFNRLNALEKKLVTGFRSLNSDWQKKLVDFVTVE